MIGSDVMATRVMRKFLILAACSAAILGGKVADAQNQKGITLTGTITQSWTDPTGNRHETGYSGPLATRLCSVDRVLETQPDNSGTVTFLNVPPGRMNYRQGGKLTRRELSEGSKSRLRKLNQRLCVWTSKTLGL